MESISRDQERKDNNYSEVNIAIMMEKSGDNFLHPQKEVSTSKLGNQREKYSVGCTASPCCKNIINLNSKLVGFLLAVFVVLGWGVCTLTVSKACYDLFGVDSITSILTGFAISTTLTVTTPVIVPHGRAFQVVSVLIFLLANAGALSVTIGAELLPHRDDFEMSELSIVTQDALTLGGIHLLIIALMLGLKCLARSLFHAQLPSQKSSMLRKVI